MDAWDTKCGWKSLVCSTCEACVTDQELIASLKTKSELPPSGNYPPEAKHMKFPSPDWCSAVVTSNLGGLGPDTSAAPELRYSGIDGIDTVEHVEAVDLVVTAISDYK